MKQNLIDSGLNKQVLFILTVSKIPRIRSCCFFIQLFKNAESRDSVFYSSSTQPTCQSLRDNLLILRTSQLQNAPVLSIIFIFKVTRKEAGIDTSCHLAFNFKKGRIPHATFSYFFLGWCWLDRKLQPKGSLEKQLFSWAFCKDEYDQDFVQENGKGGVNIEHQTNNFFGRSIFVPLIASSIQIFTIDLILCLLFPTIQSSLTISQLFSSQPEV